MNVHLHMHRCRLRDLEAAVIIFIYSSYALVRRHKKKEKWHALVHLGIDIGKPADVETLIAFMGKPPRLSRSFNRESKPTPPGEQLRQIIAALRSEG